LHRENGALILLDIPTDFSRQEQHASVGHITKILAEVSEEFPSVESRWSGMLRFADSSASRMEAELNLLSILNIIIVISFLFYSFRSFRPFFLCLLAIASGMLGGAAAVVLWKQSIHILTLAFGGSLLGACVDYPLHYFCAAREKNKAHVILSITLGALTTAIAFLSLIFSGFEGLIEISVFSIGSVLFTWLTVYCVHSQIEVTFPKYETFGVICDAVSKFIQKFRYLLLAGLVLVFAFGFMRFSTDDDVRLLQPSSPVLIEAEKWIQEQSGQGIPSGMLFVKGESESQLNSRVREIASALGGLVESGALSAFESRHSVFPSLEDQRESAEIYQKFIDKNGAEIRRALSELGLEENLIEKVFVISEPQDFSFKHFDLEATKGYHWSFIPIYGLRDAALVAELISEKGFYYNATKEITEIFSGYRERSVFLVGLSYLCILLLFIFKYGPMTGVRCFTPAVCSALGGLFLLAALGLPISFFSILALIIVLGLTIDYSIFYLEGGYQRIPPSILISALTTMFSFGLLGTSSTPVLSHFGIVVASGVFFSLFLTHPRT
jgi:predicted exporter